MGALDDFLSETTRGMMAPGEVVLAAAFAEATGPDGERSFGLVGTTQRLFAVETQRSAMHGGMTTTLRGVVAYEYRFVTQVYTASGLAARAPMRTRLQLFADGGAKSDSFLVPNASVFMEKPATHELFIERYIPWLSAHVSRGAFRDANSAAAAVQDWSSMSVAAAAQTALQQEAKKHASIKWPYGLSVAGLAVGALGFLMYNRATAQFALAESQLSSYRANPSSPMYAAVAPGYAGELQSGVDLWQGRVTTATLVLALGLALFAGMIALGIVLNKRKRQRLAAASATPPS